MRPNKKREVPAPGMVPGRAERHDHLALATQQPRHFFQYGIWVPEMFERVNRENDVRLRIEPLNESAIRDTSGRLPRASGHQMLFLNVEADYFLSAMPGHFDSLKAGATAEIENGFASDLIPYAGPK